MAKTEKTSIALGKEELTAARRAAVKEGLSLSAFLARLVREHMAQEARFDAMDLYLERFAPGFQLSDAARATISSEWTAPLRPVRRRKRIA